MTADSWIIQSLGAKKVRKAVEEAGLRRLGNALGVAGAGEFPDDQLRFVANGLELRVFDLLEGDDPEGLQAAATDVFQVARSLTCPEAPIEAAE